MRFFLFLLLSVASCLAGEPLRVGIVRLGEPSSSRVVAEKVGKLDGVAVIQDEFKLEGGRKESEITKEERISLGLKSQVQLLIIIDIKGDAFSYVDAATGDELFRIREETPQGLANSACVLVEELRDTVKAEAKASPAK